MSFGRSNDEQEQACSAGKRRERARAAALFYPSAPLLVAAAGDKASMRFLEFFAANIRNPNTRRAHSRAEISEVMRGQRRTVDRRHPAAECRHLEKFVPD
jgi:hypothetical protein